MGPIAVDLVLLRAGVPDLVLAPGRSLLARVLERGPANVGIINLAGAILTAELPAHVRAGDRLRLVVRETTGERVLLQIALPVEPRAAARAPGGAGVAVPEVRWPGVGPLQVVAREGAADGDGGDHGAVTLRLDAPALGPIELRVALDPGGVRARVTLAPGTPLELGQAAAPALRDALARAAGRPAVVEIAPRRDLLDVYA